MKKIETLTIEQESKFDEFVDKWVKIGLSTDLPDEDAIINAIPQYYKEGELEPPDTVIICASPLAAVYAGAEILTKNRKDSNFRDNAIEVWGSRVGTSLWSGYNSWRDYMSFIGVDISELAPAFILAEHSCYIFPYNNFITISEKPSKICLDEQGELHNEYSMAIEWRDGFGFYCLHGIRMCGCEWFFDQSKSEDEKMDLILKTTNTEQRVAMMRYLGYDKFIDKISAKLLDEDESTKDKLYTIEIENQRVGPYLMMTCPSTGKVYFEGVGDADKYENIDPTIKTCKDAHLWRYQRAANNLLKNINGFEVKLLEFNT